MPFKPNYQQARGDRNRAKEQKKQEKLRRREEESQKRKATRDGEVQDTDQAPAPGDEK